MSNETKPMTPAEMQAELERLRAENAQLKAAPPRRPLALKVSPKGAITVTGLNSKFGVTLYAGQWEAVLGFLTMEKLKAFIEANKSQLSTGKKPTVVETKAA